MAKADLNKLNANVRFRGDYQNKQKFPDANINAEIQTAFGAFYELVDDTNQGWWITQDTVTTTNGVAFAPLPLNVWRERRIDLLDGDEYITMRSIGFEDANRFGTQTDQPVAYMLSARGIELFPPPDATYTLRVTFAPTAPQLAAAQEREWYNGWDEYVVEAALIVLDRLNKKPHQDRIDALAEIRRRVVAGAQKRNSQEPEYIPLRDGYNILLPRDRGIF